MAGINSGAARLRAWWAYKQALNGALMGASPAQVLNHTGWARSVGGCTPYLTLFSRARVSREAADGAVSQLEIHEIPAARGCTYVVPASDFALALSLAQPCFRGDLKTALKLGVTEREIDRLCDSVLRALAKGPLDPEAIRTATGSASRSLGEEGKKKGLSTTLPLAFSRLQATGEIRRVPLNRRLDQQRYAYTLWRPNPARELLLYSRRSFPRNRPASLLLDRSGYRRGISMVLRIQSQSVPRRAAAAQAGKPGRRTPHSCFRTRSL